jgi:hypothetical protein
MQKYLAKITAKQTFLIILGIVVFAIFFRFFTLLEFPDSSIVLEKGDPLIKEQSNESLQQKFTANRSNLTKIEFLLRTPGLKAGDTLKMQLADESCKKIVRTGTLGKSYLASDNLYEFSFAKIPDSNGKTFCVISTFKPKSSSAKALLFFTQTDKQPASPVQNLTTGEADSAQALSIRQTYTNDHWWQNLTELNQRLSQYKPWFLKHFFLATIIILFVILSTGLVAVLISI